MSLTEVFAEVERWTPAQREELEWRLKMIKLTTDPEYMAEIGRRIDDAEEGRCVSSEDFRAAMEARGVTSH